MRIGLDLDGVTFDFLSHFMEFFNKLYGTDFKKEQITSYDWQECLPVTKTQFYRALDLYDEEGQWVSMPFFPGVVDKLRERIEAGDEICLATVRPERGLSQALEAFERSGIKIAHAIRARTRLGKAEEVASLRVDYYTEDRDKYCLQIAEHGIPVICVDQSHNLAWKIPAGLPIVRARNLVEAIDMAPEHVRASRTA